MKLFTATNIFLASAVAAYSLYDRFFLPHCAAAGYHRAAALVVPRTAVIAEPKFWLTAVQTVVISYRVLASALLTGLTFLLDLVLLPMWDLVWHPIAMESDWLPRNEAGVLASIAGLLLIALVSSQMQ